jgi:hypothetical protein
VPHSPSPLNIARCGYTPDTHGSLQTGRFASAVKPFSTAAEINPKINIAFLDITIFPSFQLVHFACFSKCHTVFLFLFMRQFGHHREMVGSEGILDHVRILYLKA